MIVKKFILLLSIALLSNSSLLALNGLYVGGVIGESIILSDQSGHSVGTLGGVTLFNSYPLDLRTDLFSEHFSGMFYAGIGRCWKIFYGSFEVYGQYSHDTLHASRSNSILIVSDGTSESIFDTTRVNVGPWQYGIDARPGLLFGKTLLYARVGVAFSRLELETESRNSAGIPELFNFPFNDSKNKHSQFLRVGGGIERHFTPRLTLRADYIYTDYRKLSLSGSNNGGESTLFTFTDSKEVKLRNHRFMVGLSYYLCCDPCNVCPIECCEPRFCGLYLGAGVGGAITEGRHSLDDSVISPGEGAAFVALHPNRVNNHLARGNVLGTVYLGYGLKFGWDCLQLFTGLEGFGQYFAYSRERTETRQFNNAFVPALFTSSTRTKIKTKIDPWQFGIDLRFGPFLSPCTLVYGTVGTAVATLRASTETAFSNSAVALNSNLSERKTRAVLRVGGGIEHAFCSCWHIRADYRYTDYRTLNFEGFQSASAGVTGLVSSRVNTKVHPIEHGVVVSLNRYL